MQFLGFHLAFLVVARQYHKVSLASPRERQLRQHLMQLEGCCALGNTMDVPYHSHMTLKRPYPFETDCGHASYSEPQHAYDVTPVEEPLFLLGSVWLTYLD